jgi:uroporphyrinogen-III synthase
VAVGESTGETYRLVGADSNPIILSPSGALTATFDANLLVIGSGSANRFMAHILQHITITPAGEITALVDVLSIECR